MPYRYEIDVDRRVVIATLWGSASIVDVRAIMAELYADPKHSFSMHRVYDCRDLTRLPTVGEIRGVAEMFRRVRKEQGRLDNVLNNAGIASMNHALLTPLASVRTIFETNVMGTFLLCREGARLMAKRKTGRIVNFATVATPLRLEGEAAYAASKAAVVSLTEVLAREFAPYGITVNAVGPTPVPTDLIKSVPQEKMDALLARQAIKRFGTMEDVGNACDFFLRPESDFITAQTIYLGGV